jgi:hypothetical protein
MCHTQNPSCSGDELTRTTILRPVRAKVTERHCLSQKQNFKKSTYVGEWLPQMLNILQVLLYKKTKQNEKTWGLCLSILHQCLTQWAQLHVNFKVPIGNWSAVCISCSTWDSCLWEPWAFSEETQESCGEA